ncbi:MAG: hypothetical protein ACRERX_22205 [Pseudomonas sp.]
MRVALIGLLALNVALVGCRESGDEVLGIDATGDLRGEAYLDRDGNGQRTPLIDTPFPRLRVDVVPVAGGASVATVTTDTLGQFRVRNLAVGSYRLRPDPATVGDTVRVERIDSAVVTVAANDTTSSLVTIGYRTPTMAEIAALGNGARVGLLATALNSWPTFGDSTIHFADSTGAVRAVFLPAVTITPGDTVRATGTVTRHLGAVAITSVTIIRRASGDLPAPIAATTFAAARAGGRLSAAQVRVLRARVVEASSLPGGDVLFVVDDGSGQLQVVVDASAAVTTALPISLGAELDVTGLLVPINDGSGRWRLKPRFTGDVVVRYQRISIASARAQQPGQYVMVHGIALNEVLNLGDRSVHVSDASAAIRVLLAPGQNFFFVAGDSISVFGQIDMNSSTTNLPVLRPINLAVLATRIVPPPSAFTTLRAATADNGQRDAALVRVTTATVDSVAGSSVRRLNDGSGFVEMTPPAGQFPLPAVGSRVNVTGLLVPVAPGRWVIRPRTTADLVIVP